MVSVENLKKNEVPVFYDLEENVDEFTVVGKNLAPISISYFLQIWKFGKIIIPPIPIDIMKNNGDISRIETNKISMDILSNISNSSNEMRSIKPMKKINLKSPWNIGLVLFLFIAGLGGGWYLWQSKTKLKKSIYKQEVFKISSLKESIRKIEELPLPAIINTDSTEKYYLKLSEICRLFLKEVFYIKATEMTSSEIANHFSLIGIESDLVKSWHNISQIADLSKYACQIPHVEQFTIDKKVYIDLLTSFNKIQNESKNNS